MGERSEQLASCEESIHIGAVIEAQTTVMEQLPHEQLTISTRSEMELLQPIALQEIQSIIAILYLSI